ncbi:hypothetical protein [Listeria booriae]|uniref:hypothetical protein n=1 Tax=Listeria booriae TaxID=1552123 RepID=UPI001629C6BB|nr:hypothetical protein [Listeria booriae]MBC1290634.1 hypothetical protein [Listeria booriae]MBC2163415.1 hypothetical protein [Listeria booriae]
MRTLDMRDVLAEQAMSLRYTLNSEKVNMKKVLNKQKEERQIRERYQKDSDTRNISIGNREKAMQAIEYFKNRG